MSSSALTFYDRLSRLSIDWDALAFELRWTFCEGNGRPTDPTLYLKCFFVGHVENIERDTDLAARLSDSISIRRFLFGTLAKSPPDHSSLSRVRRTMAERCDFDTVLVKVVALLESHGLVGGEAVAMDTSLVPSRARICFASEPACTEESTAGVSSTDAAVEPGLVADLSERPAPVSSDRAEVAPDDISEPSQELEEHFHPKPPKKSEAKKRKQVASPYDLEAHPARKPGYEAQPSYKVGVAADYKARVILAANAYPASLGEGHSMRRLFSDLVRTLGQVPRHAVADAGMDDAGFHAAVELFGGVPVTPLKKNSSVASGFGKERFAYDAERDVYVCPAGEILKSRSSIDKLRRSYVASMPTCNQCPLKLWCYGSLKGPKQVDRTFDEDSRDRVVAARKDPERRKLLAYRKAVVEPVFAEFKGFSGMGMIWTKGLACAEMKAKLAAVKWNIKILMRHLESQERTKAKAPTPRKPTKGSPQNAVLFAF